MTTVEKGQQTLKKMKKRNKKPPEAKQKKRKIHLKKSEQKQFLLRGKAKSTGHYGCSQSSLMTGKLENDHSRKL